MGVAMIDSLHLGVGRCGPIYNQLTPLAGVVIQ